MSILDKAKEAAAAAIEKTREVASSAVEVVEETASRRRNWHRKPARPWLTASVQRLKKPGN